VLLPSLEKACGPYAVDWLLNRLCQLDKTTEEALSEWDRVIKEAALTCTRTFVGEGDLAFMPCLREVSGGLWTG